MKTTKNKSIDIKQKVKKKVWSYIIMLQHVQGRYEKLLLQEQGYLFAENPITDFYFDGMNKHTLISDNFEIPNYEIVINANGYISITDDTSTVWYQVTTESQVQSPYARTVLNCHWNELDIDSIINSFALEADLHNFMELLEVEVSILKQRLWLLNNATFKLVLIEDEKLLQQITSLMEVA